MIKQISIDLLPSPYENNVWGTERLISKNNIKQCIKMKKFKNDPFDNQKWTANDHEQRIAFLIVTNNKEPISLDVGVFYFNCCNFFQDGHHRLAAAIYKNEESIPCAFSGSDIIIKEFLEGNHS